MLQASTIQGCYRRITPKVDAVVLGVTLIIFVIAIAAFLYMGGMRGKKFGWTLGGTVFLAFAAIGAMMPKAPPLPACEPGYGRDVTGKGNCSMTCAYFENHTPTTDKESNYYLYCKQHEAKQFERMIGGPDAARKFDNLIAETADRQRGLSERDVTLRKIERDLRDR